MAKTLSDILAELESLGNEKIRAQNRRNGAGENQFGVKLGDIRKLAAELKSDELVQPLWASGNLEARLLALLLIKPKKLPRERLVAMARDVDNSQLADWFNAYLLKQHPDKEQLRLEWLQAQEPWLARAGWSLTNERILKQPEGLDLPGLLDRIEAEMGAAPPEVQWTMNFCLGGIGINFPQHRARARAIGEKLGLYRDYPVSKGCTTPYVPTWIDEMVRRQG